MRPILLFFIVLVFYSCAQIEQEENKFLASSSRVFVTEDGPHIDDEFGSTQEFETQSLKVEYRQDTIYATAMQYVNACGDAIAWVEIYGDTLALSTKETQAELCASGSWLKFEYWIKNPQNKKYVVVQD